MPKWLSLGYWTYIMELRVTLHIFMRRELRQHKLRVLVEPVLLKLQPTHSFLFMMSLHQQDWVSLRHARQYNVFQRDNRSQLPKDSLVFRKNFRPESLLA